MSLNYFEIEEALKIFPQNGIIKRIFQPDKYSIIINTLVLKNEYNILASVKDSVNMICLIPEDIKPEKDNQRFSDLLNANIAGLRIRSFKQYNNSRVIELILNNINNEVKKIIFRLWGKGGNILLTDGENNIIDCLRRFSKRGEWPLEEFIFPENKSNDLKFSIRKEFENKIINDSIYFFYKKILDKESLISKKNEVKILLDKAVKDTKETLENINKNLLYDNEELYLKYGELLKSNLYHIKKGLSEIELEDYEGGKIIIPLNSELSANDNSIKYFEKYKKLKTGKIKREEEKNKCLLKLKELEHFNKLSRETDEIDKLNQLILELKIFLKIKEKKFENTEKNAPKRFILQGGYTSYVSKSAKDAFDLLKNYAKGNDYWFHIRDYPGCHVIVKKFKQDEITESAKNEAAALAVYYSKKRNTIDADVYFTQVKYLHKGKGGPAGLVFPTQEENIKLKFNKETINKIFSRS